MRKQSAFIIGFALSLFLSILAVLPALALAAQVQVSLSATAISPSTITVNPGDTVVWTNSSASAQSVTGNNNLFQSGSIAPGGQFAATFNTSGTYNYYDNSGGTAILGEVIVSGNSTAPTAANSTAYNSNANYYTTTTSGSSNPTVSSLESQVQSLIAQINSIEGSGAASAGSTGYSTAPNYTVSSGCPQIGRVLSVGASGSDVASLQAWLGVSPATGYYGSLTQAAVQKYQVNNSIISYGTPATTGYGVVGPRTAAAIRLACGEGQTGASSSSTGSSSGSNVQSGFLQVSPISGNAPLTVSATVTVNVAQSCGGGTYNLDFGDGSQSQTITVPAGNCSQQNQVFPHTYANGGTYTITLSAGSHSSTATVTVYGSAGSSGTAVNNGNQASGSISAFVTVGPAPLQTTFYVSCAAGLAYDVVFGDGSDLGSSGVSQSSCNGGLQSVAHTYAKPGSYNAELVIFIRNSQGTISSQNVATQAISVTGASSGSSSTPSATKSFTPPTLTPNVGGNPLAVSLQFNAGTCTGAYSIAWGDTGVSVSPAVDNTNGCNPSAVQTYTPSHTYSAAGSYTVTLTRATPSGSSQTDSVAVSISN